MLNRKIAIVAIPILVIVISQLFSTSDYPITNAPASLDTIMSFGDSLTYGTGAGKNMSYPAQLSRRIGLNIINEGKPGDTTASALTRIDAALEQNPTLVLLTLGGNDLKNGVSSKLAFPQLEKVITAFQAQGAVVVLGGVNIPIYDRGYSEAYEQVAEKTGAILIPNVLSGIFSQKDLMSDPIHPNAKGYSKMTDYFYEAIKPYL